MRIPLGNELDRETVDVPATFRYCVVEKDRSNRCMQSKNTSYLARLDHLRALAAFMVLFFHIHLQTLNALPQSILSKIPVIQQGHSGVALFMVISGFILAHIVGNAEIDVPRFYLNRILRIYPLFIFIIALGFFATRDPRPVSDGVEFLMALLPISNLYRLHYGMYGGVLWSVAVELQFYLLFPLIYRQLRSAGWPAYVILLAALMSARAIVYFTTGSAHQLAYFSLFGGLDAFIFGFMADAAYRKLDGRKLPVWLPILVFVGIVVLLDVAFRRQSLFVVDYNHLTPDGISKSALWIVWPTIQAASFGALIVSYLAAAPIDFGSKISDIVAWLGKISYSLYIWHTAVQLMVMPRLQSATGIWLYVAGLFFVAVCVIVAAVSYYVIERPFLAYRVRYLKIATETSPA